MEQHKKSHPQLFSSLPDVSSLGQSGTAGIHEDAFCESTESLSLRAEAVSKPDSLDADVDSDLGELDSQLDTQFAPNHPGDDQRIPDCIVESVMNDDQVGDEEQGAFFESIGQRVRRERASRRSGLDTEEPADLVKDTDPSDRERSEHELAEGAKLLDFEGDWPTERSLKQRQVRRRERPDETSVNKAGEGAIDDETGTSEQSGSVVTEFQKLLDLIQTGVVPVQTGSSCSQSLSQSSEDEIQKEDEAGGSKGELPDCVQDGKTADTGTVANLRDCDRERVEIQNKTSSTEKNTDVSGTGGELVDFKTEDLNLTSVCGDKLENSHVHQEASRDVNLKELAENTRQALGKRDDSYVSEACESPVCEGVTENSSGSQERKQRQGRRSGKHCKLALTFTQNCPTSLLNSSDYSNTTADVKDHDTNSVNADLKPTFNPALGTSCDFKPDLSDSDGQLQPPASLVPMETGRFTQTEPRDLALLWRLNHLNGSDATAGGGQSGDLHVTEGNSSRFVPQPSTAALADQVPYCVVHEKGTQVEERELGVTVDRLESLRILSCHFKLVSFDTLEDLYDKCHQDLEWTTNLLLDSGERFFKDEEEEEHGAADKNHNASSLCEGSCENTETVKRPEASNQHEDCLKGEQTELKEDILQSACGREGDGNVCVFSKEAPGTNQEPSGTTLKTEPNLPEAEKESEQGISADHKVTSEPGPEGESWVGSMRREEIPDESRTRVQDELANMDEINRLLQAELEELEWEDERRKAQRCSQHLDIQTVELKLPTELALQLTELFGPVGVDPGN